MIQELQAALDKDLAALRREVEQYPDDAALWRQLPGLANPGGTLALHLAGNLQYFFGAHLAGSGYVRDRDREFSVRGLGREQVLAEVAAAAEAVRAGLAALDPAALDREFPVPFGGKPVGTRHILLHLVAHLGYHLGQINYHRRMAASKT